MRPQLDMYFRMSACTAIRIRIRNKVCSLQVCLLVRKLQERKYTLADNVESLMDSWHPHTVCSDPGTCWIKAAEPAVNVPPDEQIDPRPDAQWSAAGLRSGIYGVVTPNVVPLQDGGYRLYYTQILPRPGFPAGANDYDNATSRILSARSENGETWIPEPGVRLLPQQSGPGTLRVVSPEVVPAGDNRDRLRMYYEDCRGPGLDAASLKSAGSEDGGLTWTVESGVRMGDGDRSFISPRAVFLEDGRCRLYYAERGKGIRSALSGDGGLTFRQEPGLRIGSERSDNAPMAFAPEILSIKGGGFRMYYAQYATSKAACIMSALSDDGLTWQKDCEMTIAPGGAWDTVKASEMCVMPLGKSDEKGAGYRMLYEACDGTATDKRGVWRIATAISQ